MEKKLGYVLLWKAQAQELHWHAPSEVTRVNGCPFTPPTAQKSTSKHVPLAGICRTIRKGMMQGDRISPSLFCFTCVLPYPLQDATPTAGKFRDIFTKFTKGPWGCAGGGGFAVVFLCNLLRAARNKHTPSALGPPRRQARPRGGPQRGGRCSAERGEGKAGKGEGRRGGRRHVVWGRLGDQACHQRDPEDRRRGEGDGHGETPRARAAPAGPEPGVGLLGAALRPHGAGVAACRDRYREKHAL